MRNTVAAFVVIAMFLAAGGIAFAHGGKHKTTDTGNGASHTRDILPIFEKNCISSGQASLWTMRLSRALMASSGMNA